MTARGEPRQSENMKAQFVSSSLILLFACGGSTLDVGSNKGGSANGAEGGGDSTTGGEAAASGGSTSLGGSNFARGGAPTTATGGVSVGGRGEVPSSGGTEFVGAGGATRATGGKPIGGDVSFPATGGTIGIATGGGTSAGGIPSSPLVPQVCSKAFAQVWEGNTLDFFFNPQDDRWRIEFDGTDANGRLCGTVTYIGAGEPAPPPATDPDAAYPSDVDFSTGRARSVHAGVTYSIIQGAEADGVRHFRISANELWKDWCALQTPVKSVGGYACVDDYWTTTDGAVCTVVKEDGSQRHYPYGKCDLCRNPGVCACDSKRCIAGDGNSVVFDLQISGTQMTGTIGGTQAKFDLKM